MHKPLNAFTTVGDIIHTLKLIDISRHVNTFITREVRKIKTYKDLVKYIIIKHDRKNILTKLDICNLLGIKCIESDQPYEYVIDLYTNGLKISYSSEDDFYIQLVYIYTIIFRGIQFHYPLNNEEDEDYETLNNEIYKEARDLKLCINLYNEFIKSQLTNKLSLESITVIDNNSILENILKDLKTIKEKEWKNKKRRLKS